MHPVMHEALGAQHIRDLRAQAETGQRVREARRARRARRGGQAQAQASQLCPPAHRLRSA